MYITVVFSLAEQASMSVCALVLAIVNEAQTAWQIHPHRPLLAVWM